MLLIQRLLQKKIALDATPTYGWWNQNSPIILTFFVSKTHGLSLKSRLQSEKEIKPTTLKETQKATLAYLYTPNSTILTDDHIFFCF